MIDLRKLTFVALLAAGCAGATMTPEQKMVHELFVEAAYQCESRYHTIHVDQVDIDGGLKIHSEAESRSEYRGFVTCYADGLKARAERLRKAGQTAPEALTRAPDVDLE